MDRASSFTRLASNVGQYQFGGTSVVWSTPPSVPTKQRDPDWAMNEIFMIWNNLYSSLSAHDMCLIHVAFARVPIRKVGERAHELTLIGEGKRAHGHMNTDYMAFCC